MNYCSTKWKILEYNILYYIHCTKYYYLTTGNVKLNPSVPKISSANNISPKFSNQHNDQTINYAI